MGPLAVRGVGTAHYSKRQVLRFAESGKTLQLTIPNSCRVQEDATTYCSGSSTQIRVGRIRRRCRARLAGTRASETAVFDMKNRIVGTFRFSFEGMPMTWNYASCECAFFQLVYAFTHNSTFRDPQLGFSCRLSRFAMTESEKSRIVGQE